MYDQLEIYMSFTTLPSPIPIVASTITRHFLVHRTAVIPLVIALLACGLVRISDRPVPIFVLAPLCVVIHAALVLTVTSIFASLAATGALVRWALG